MKEFLNSRLKDNCSLFWDNKDDTKNVFVILQANDRDESGSSNSIVTYSIIQSEFSEYFTIADLGNGAGKLDICFFLKWLYVLQIRKFFWHVNLKNMYIKHHKKTLHTFSSHLIQPHIRSHTCKNIKSAEQK